MILYEDKEIIVCHKQAGVPVQSARLGQKDMVSILNNYLAAKGERMQVNVVHRLDQPVEGVIVFAKTKKAAAELGRQIQQGSMRKVYYAVCCDVLEHYSGESEDSGKQKNLKIKTQNDTEKWKQGVSYQLLDYLAKDGRTNTSSVVNQGHRDAKRAELSFSVIGEYEKCPGSEHFESENSESEQFESESAVSAGRKYILTEIELKTGRHHQIRVQMSHAGLPLYGDQKYNQKWQEYQLNLIKGEKNTGLALCAVSLTFRHPAKGKQMTFEVKPEAPVFQLFRETAVM